MPAQVRALALACCAALGRCLTSAMPLPLAVLAVLCRAADARYAAAAAPAAAAAATSRGSVFNYYHRAQTFPLEENHREGEKTRFWSHFKC